MTSGTPINIAAEQVVLGTILMDNRALGAMADLKAEHFSEPLHAVLFGKCQEMIEAGETAAPVPMAAYFRDRKVTEELTVPQYITRLLGMAVTAAEARSYARQLADFAARRQLMVVGEQLLANASNLALPVRDMAGDAIDVISESAASVSRVSRQMTVDAALEVCLSARGRPILSTGLASLDAAIGGIQPGMFTIFAGRPGMGKTVLASNLSRSLAMRGNGVILFSLEMSLMAMWARFVSDHMWNNHTPVQFGKLLRGNVADYDEPRVRSAHAELKALPLIVDAGRNLTVGQIAQRTRRAAADMARRGQSLKAVIIDHMGKVNPGDRYKGQKQNEVAYISGALADLSNEVGEEHGAGLVAMSQLNRSVESSGSEDKRIPELHHLRDSGALEQDARIVGALYRDAYYAEKALEKSAADEHDTKLEELINVRNLYQIHMLKNDSGPLSVCRCSVDIGCSAIRDAGVCTTNYYEGWA
jgi:replicative DNA helicase